MATWEFRRSGTVCLCPASEKPWGEHLRTFELRDEQAAMIAADEGLQLLLGAVFSLALITPALTVRSVLRIPQMPAVLNELLEIALREGTLYRFGDR